MNQRSNPPNQQSNPQHRHCQLSQRRNLAKPGCLCRRMKRRRPAILLNQQNRMMRLRRTNLPTLLNPPNLRCPMFRLMNPLLRLKPLNRKNRKNRLNLLNRKNRLNLMNLMNWQSPMNSLNCLTMRAAAPGRNCWQRAW
jgi:hypothetical protein